MPLTNYTEAKLLDHYHGIAWTVPATVYFALHVHATNLPNKDSGASFVEPTDGNYARVSKANTSATWNSAVGGAPTSADNKVEIDFGTAAANYADPIRAIGVFDAASGGNLLEIHPLVTPKTPSASDPIKIPVNQLKTEFGKPGDTLSES